MYKTIMAILVSLALMGLATTTTAQEDYVGLSGQCYNADASQGGQDEARVYTDGNVVVLPGTVDDTDVGNPTLGGAAPALLLFATESVNDGGNTGNACKRTNCFEESGCPWRELRYDYLEVSASLAGFAVQVCYNGGVDLTGSCPTSPTGPGVPHD
jgi:hypothetical protein